MATAALVAWGVAVAICDWRTRRIPNLLLLAMLIPELIVLIVRGEGLLGHNATAGLVGASLAAAVFLPGYLMGLSGGGDVKLAACCGLIVGMPGTLLMLFVAAIILGLLSAFVMWRRRLQVATVTPARIAAGPALVAGFSAAVVLSQLARIAS